MVMLKFRFCLKGKSPFSYRTAKTKPGEPMRKRQLVPSPAITRKRSTRNSPKPKSHPSKMDSTSPSAFPFVSQIHEEFRSPLTRSNILRQKINPPTNKGTNQGAFAVLK